MPEQGTPDRPGIPLGAMAVVISEGDNVAVAKADIARGTLLDYEGRQVSILQAIPLAHRFSLTDIVEGELLVQYGYPFGISKGIQTGQLVSQENVGTYQDEYQSRVMEIATRRKDKPQDWSGNTYSAKTFLGYKRDAVSVGTRNYYVIIPTSLCASDVATNIAQTLGADRGLLQKYRNIDGIVAAAHTEGCGCNDGGIIDRLLLTLRNTIAHPNVGGALVIDLGCEKTNQRVMQEYLGDMPQYNKPVDFISIQELGGTGSSLTRGKSTVISRLPEVDAIKREEVPLKYLVVGTECGASDSFSGVTANPLIGWVVDKVINVGGSAILSEVPEMIGAEACLMSRMKSRRVVLKFLKGMRYYKSLARRLRVSMEDNVVPGNKSGGLVNLTLKSLGAILKGGTTEIVDFIDYAERIKYPGLSIMNGPGNDLESMTGLVASGATVILFSTGSGTTEGNLIVPTIKIPTTSRVFNRMKEDMDFNAGRLLDEDISLDDLSDELMEMVTEVASGRKTCSEIWGKHSFQIWTAGKLSL